MRENFERCLAETLAHEGGYVNDKRDPGGETNMGISKRSYPNEDIRNMTRARAAQIYRRDFWNKVRGDDLPLGLDMVAFDGAVNSGPSQGARWLQEALGVDADGKVGPLTISAAQSLHRQTIIERAMDIRMAFLQRLSTWPTFGRGWSRRVASVRAAALDMAAQDKQPAPSAPAPSTNPLAALLRALVALFTRRKQ